MPDSRQTQIEIFAGNGDTGRLKIIFESNYTQSEIDKALDNAVAYSQNETADYLLSLGADFSNSNYNGVYYAVHNNELEGLKFAVGKGVDVNIDDGLLLNTSIMTAINTKSIEIVKWLLDNGANPEFLTEHSLTLVDEYGSGELKNLLKKKHVINAWRTTMSATGSKQ